MSLDRPAARRDRGAAHGGQARQRSQYRIRSDRGETRSMIDLALKMLLDEKARFAATVLGVGFAAALVLVQVGLFFGLLENASITIDKLDADLWITARNTPNVDFGNPFPEGYVQRVRSIPGVARADNSDRLVRDRRAAIGREGIGRLLRPGELPGLGFPLGRRVGRSGRSPARPLRDARPLGRAPVRSIPGRRLPRISGSPAEDHRPHPRSTLVHDEPDRVPRLSAGAVAFAGRAVGANDVHRRPARARSRCGRRPARDLPPAALQRRLLEPSNGPRGRAVTGSRAPGWGLTLFLTVALGALVGVVIVAQTLYASTTEHLTEFGTVKALGGGNLTVYGIIAEQASFAAVLGFGVALRDCRRARARPGAARHEDDRFSHAGGAGLRRHAGALPGSGDPVVSQGGVARPGDRLSRLSRSRSRGRPVHGGGARGSKPDEDLSRWQARRCRAPRRVALGFARVRWWRSWAHRARGRRRSSASWVAC